MTVFAVMLIVVGFLCLATAGLCFAVHVVFQRRPDLTSKTGADLLDANHKRNVTLFKYHPGRRMFFKHLTKAVYVYTVRGKDYVVRNQHFGTLRQTPRIIPIVYITKYPRFRYINKYGVADSHYDMNGILLIGFGIPLISLGIYALSII